MPGIEPESRQVQGKHPTRCVITWALLLLFNVLDLGALSILGCAQDLPWRGKCLTSVLGFQSCTPLFGGVDEV